jgi:hypothetical protein
VRLSLCPRLGFLTGWACFSTTFWSDLHDLWLDHPRQAGPRATVLGVGAAHGRDTPSSPRHRFTARTNLVLMIVMTAVISAFIVLAIRMLTAAAGWRGVSPLRSTILRPSTFKRS